LKSPPPGGLKKQGVKMKHYGIYYLSFSNSERWKKAFEMTDYEKASTWLSLLQAQVHPFCSRLVRSTFPNLPEELERTDKLAADLDIIAPIKSKWNANFQLETSTEIRA
jgi:hypothetical protein